MYHPYQCIVSSVVSSFCMETSLGIFPVWEHPFSRYDMVTFQHLCVQSLYGDLFRGDSCMGVPILEIRQWVDFFINCRSSLCMEASLEMTPVWEYLFLVNNISLRIEYFYFWSFVTFVLFFFYYQYLYQDSSL